MRRFLLPITVFLCVIWAAETQAQAIYSRCNRATIETFSGQEKQPVLLYLDESRKAADNFVRLLAEGKFETLYNMGIFAQLLETAQFGSN